MKKNLSNIFLGPDNQNSFNRVCCYFMLVIIITRVIKIIYMRLFKVKGSSCHRVCLIVLPPSGCLSPDFRNRQELSRKLFLEAVTGEGCHASSLHPCHCVHNWSLMLLCFTTSKLVWRYIFAGRREFEGRPFFLKKNNYLVIEHIPVT